MILNSELGIVMDTIGYGIAAINREAVFSDLKKKQVSAEPLEAFLTAMDREVGELPSWCKALFYVRENDKCLPESFFLHKRLIPDYSLVHLLECVGKQEIFFQALAEWFFPELDGSMVILLAERNLAAWYQACAMLGLPDAIKLELLYICGNFEDVRKEFHLLLAKIYRLVKHYHAANAKRIELAVEDINNPDNQEELEERVNYLWDDGEIQQTEIGVLMWQPCILTALSPEWSMAKCVLCGVNYREANVTPSKWSEFDYRNFIAVCGSENKINIVYLLLENGKMTASQLSKALQTSPPMTGRYMESLRNNGVVRIKNREGKNIFYELNPDYFRKIKKTAEVFWSNF